MKKLCYRVVTIVMAIFICSLPMVSSAATTGFSCPSYDDWESYGFTSKDVLNKAVSEGVNPYQVGIKNKNHPWTLSSVSDSKWCYEKYGYSSESAFESDINSGKSFGDVNSWCFPLTTEDSAAATMCDPEIGVPIIAGSILSGVVYKNQDQAKNFVTGFYQYLGKQVGITPEMLDNFKKQFIVEKNGFCALNSTCLEYLKSYISGFAGKSDAEITKLTSTDDSHLLIADNSYEFLAPNGLKFEANKTYIIYCIVDGLTAKGNGTTYVSICCGNTSLWRPSWGIGLNTAVSREMTVVTGDSTSIKVIIGNDNYSVNATYDNLKFLWYTSTNASVIEGYSVSNNIAVGDASATKTGAPSINNTYSNTYVNTDTPPYVCDPTKTKTINDAVNVDAQSIPASTTIPVEATSTADATTTDGTTDGNPDDATTTIDLSPFNGIDVFDKFPFSIPWDLKDMATSLMAEPVAPKWDFSVPMTQLSLPDLKFSIDFSKYDVAFIVIRWGILLVFTGGLAFCAYKLIKH